MSNIQHSCWNPLLFCQPIEVAKHLAISEISEIAHKVVSLSRTENVPLNDNLSAPLHGREVGDDRVDLSRSAEKVCCTQVVQEAVIKMVTSPEDTGIRRTSWNFCEVSSMIPTDPYTGYDHARKCGDFTNLGYNDSIILRIICDVSKGDEHHSSTPPGKMSMLGSRLNTPRRENRAVWQIASLFQDALLCTHKATEPKYLPQQMGGTGVTALFDNPENINLYVRAYKGGTYKRIYGTATAELSSCLEHLERNVQTAPVLCSRLREKQEYFWGTYSQYVFIPDKPRLPRNDNNSPQPIYSATGGANLYQGYENRLIRTRQVVTRRTAEREWATTQRQESIISGIYGSIHDAQAREKDYRLIARSRFGNALSANSALQNLLRREATLEDARILMGDHAFRTITDGKRTFERSDADWIYHNGQGEVYSLNDISMSEDIFVRTEVSNEETFKIAGITLRPITHRGIEWRPTKTKVGLYEISRSMEDWSEDLLNRLIDERSRLGGTLQASEAALVFEENPEWVNDDSGLIARAIREHKTSSGRTYGVILISDDRRLGNQMANSANVTVHRIRSEYYVHHMLRSGKPVQDYPNVQYVRESLTNGLKPYPDSVYYDTGSISAYAANIEIDNGASKPKMYRRELQRTGWSGLKRFSNIRLTEIDFKDRTPVWKHYPTERPKLWRQGSRPSGSVYTDRSSWRNSNASSSDWRNREGPPLRI